MNQVGWWDESHRKCCLKTIQGANGCEFITRVRRDANGNPCLDGQECTDSPVDVNVKYEKEVRFAFGVALIMGNDGIEVGKRIPCFEYTEQTILSRVDWARKIREEIFRVKGIAKEKGWVVSCREGRYYEADDLIILKNGLGIKMQDQLNAVGITNLGELIQAMTTPGRLQELRTLPRFTMNKVTLWTRVLSSNLLPGACPLIQIINSLIIHTCPAILTLSSTSMEIEIGRQR